MDQSFNMEERSDAVLTAGEAETRLRPELPALPDIPRRRHGPSS